MIIISGASGLIGTSLTNLLKKKRLKLKTIKTKQILIKKEAFFKKASHFIIVSPFSWITYSINITLNSLSLEHTLHPGYFIKKYD